MSFEKLNTSLIINNTANATSHLTGSLQILGGAGIAKDLYIGGATDVFVSPAQSALSVMGSIKTSKTIYIGLSANITTAPIYIASDALDGGVFRSFADPNNVIGDGAWNRYLDIACFGSSNGTIGGGSIRFFTNPVNSTNVVERMRLKTDGTLGILATTDSTVLDTGAFQVAGGGSIAKNLNIGGSVFAGNVKTIEALSGSETPVMYPPNGTRILTGNSTNVTNQPYGNGSYYIASDSAAGGFPAWNAFGNKGEVWSSGNRYSTTTGAYTGGRTTTDSAGTVFAGDLIDLGLPSSKLITSFTIYPRAGALNNAPTTFAIFNSVNNVMYLIYHQSSPITWSDNSSKTFTLATPTLSSYIRLVFMTKSPSDVYVQLSFTFTASTPYVQISGTTDATGTNTGALQILGGASIAKTLHTGGLQVTNITNSATGPAAFGGIPFNGSLHVLSNAATAAESTMSFFAKNSRTMAAAGDMYTLGISGQSGTVTAGNFGISGWNGTAAQNYLQITPAGVVSITSSLDASSLSAAAFLVVGGASVTKNVLVGGNVNLTINPLSSRIQLGNTVTNYIIIGAPLGDASGDFHIYDATGTGGRIFGYYRSPETIYLGKASGTTNVVLAGTTDSTSTTTGALQVVGGAGIAKNVTVGGEVISYISTGFGQFRAVNGNFGVMFRNDGTIFYLLSTASGAPLGVWNANRPFQYTMATNGISSDSPWSLTNTTDSTSATTGALQVTGGAGITKSLHVGTAITVGAANTGAAQNALNVTGNGTNYVQFNLQNTSSGGGGLSIAANGSATSDTVGGNGGIYMWNARLNNFCLHMKATGETILPVALDATSTTSGSVQMRGGLAVSKSIFTNKIIVNQGATGGIKLRTDTPAANYDYSISYQNSGDNLHVHMAGLNDAGDNRYYTFGYYAADTMGTWNPRVSINTFNPRIHFHGTTSGIATLAAPATITNYTMTLPAAPPAAAGMTLVADASGVLSFANVTNATGSPTFTGLTVTATTTPIVRITNTSLNDFSLLQFVNNVGGALVIFQNSSDRVADGGANCATIRNDAADLRIQAGSTAGGSTAGGIRLFYGSNDVAITTTTDSSSTATGALQVRGGLAVTKSIFSAGLNSSITHAAATNVNQLVTRFDANWGIRLNQNYVGSGDIFYQWYNTYNNFERLWLTVRNDTTTLSHPSVVISSTIDSTSGITGALQVAGGIGIAKSLTVGENIMTGTINGASYNKVFQQATNVATFYKIATLPVSTISTFDHIHIIATLNYNYNATANSEIDAMFANRNGFAYYYEARGYLPISTNATVVVYNNAGQADIYIRLTTGFLTASCTVVEAQNCTVYSTVAGATTVPTGTIIFDASNPTVYAPNRQTDASGNTATTTLALHDTFSGSEVAMLYPPTGNQILTGVNTTLTNLPYGNGLYYIAASSTFDGNFQPWFAFQDKSVSNPWSSHSRYNATGAYTGAVTTQDVVAGVSYAGEVIEVTLPATKYVTSITIYPRIANPLNAPATFVIMGSSTINAAYKVIYNQSTATTWTESTGKTFTLTTPGIYNWIRIVVQTIGANAPGGTFAQFTFSLRASNPYIYITNTAEATSTTSGALQVGGGAGITKNLHVGGTLNVPGTMTTVTDLRFPPAAMTATTTTLTNQSYGNGTYVVTSSSQNPYASVHTVFDYTGMADAGWHSDGAADLYNGDTGVFAGTTSTTIGGTAVAGAWLQLQVPVSFTLKEFTMSPRNGNANIRAPRSWILAGSNNGTTWTAIDTRTGEQSWTNAPKSFVVTNTTAYLYFRLVVREVGNLTSGGGTAQNAVNLSEVAFYASEHQLRFASTIDSVSPLTGAMQIAGGLGVAKTLNVGGVTTINQTTGDLVILKSATTTGKNDILFHNTTTGRLGYVGLDGIGLLNSNMDAMTIFSPATKPIQLYSDTSVNIIGGAGINVGTAPTTVTSKLAVNGTNVSMSGPHIAYYTSVDTQPLFHQLNWTHDNINLGFDTYYDGVWRSSTAASASAKIAKVGGALVFQYAPAAAVGTAVSHVNAMVVECATGAVTSHQTRILSDARSIFGSGLFTGNNGNAANVGDGRINIQDLSGICASFYVNNTKAGSITASGTTVAYNTTSDYRLKTNIEPVNDAKQKLQLIKPKRFNWIDGNVGEKSYGFIAHEIAEVLPEAVTGEKDAVDAEGKPVHQMLDSTKLIPLLTAALQETMKELALLKAEIVELKNRDV